MSTPVNPANFRLNSLRGFWRDGQTVVLDYNGAKLGVTVLDKTTFRFRLAPNGNFFPHRSWSPAKPDTEFPPVNFNFTPTPAGVEFSTEELLVKISKDGGLLSIFNKKGEAVLEEPAGGGFSWQSDGKVSSLKTMYPDQHFYGFGERPGLLDKRGRRYTNWTTDPWYSNPDHGPGTDLFYTAIPFFITLRPGLGSYGLYLNNTFRSTIDITDTQNGQYKLEVDGGELDYYFIYGPEPAQVLAGYTAITGRTPLPPRWSLGFHQSRWSYYPESKVREIAGQFRARNIPAEVIHLDIDYMNGFRVFTWDQNRFPDPKKLLADLAADGFKVVTIIDPGVKHEPQGSYPVFNEGFEKNYFVKTPEGTDYVGFVWPDASVFPDFSQAEVRQWWGNLHQTLLEAGVRAIWNDMNEPAVADHPFNSGLNRPTNPPLDSPVGDESERTLWAETKNAYGLNMDRATHEGLRRLRPDERPFLLTRSGFAGVQKYAAVWTGDNYDLWEHLEMTMSQLCNLGLSGIPFVGADIGGFMGNGTPELFARWIQLGAFYPFCRAHASDGTPSKEPWEWGGDVEEISRRAINLRYRLLPYFYSLFYTAAQTGAPLWRPLFYHFMADTQTHSIYDQLMVGPSLMLAPIYRPGQTKRLVYLPEGLWYDFWSDDRFNGGEYITAEADLDVIPVYMRGGSIVPFGPEMQYTDQKPFDHLTLEVYPDANGRATGILYEDDGLSYAYEKGDYCLTRFTCRIENDKAYITAQRVGTYAPAPRSLEIWLHTPGGPRNLELPRDSGTWQVEL